MNEQTHTQPDSGFVIGLVTGTLVGTGLVLWLGARMASEIRHNVAAATRTLGTASGRHDRRADHA